MKSKKISGMTLVETLVAIVIGVISSAAIFYSYNIFNKSYQGVTDKAKMSTSTRSALTMIARDLRNAGYYDINWLRDASCTGHKDPWTPCTGRRKIEKKDNTFARVMGYTTPDPVGNVKFSQTYGRGPDYLAMWYTNTPNTRYEIRYFLVARNKNNVNDMYLARDLVYKPADCSKMGPGGGKPKNCLKWGYKYYCKDKGTQTGCKPQPIIDFISDFQVVFKDKDGKELKDVCFDCSSQTGKDNQLKAHTAEIYLTVRSENKIYSKDKKVIFINDDPASRGKKTEKEDRYHRETFFVSVYLRNLDKN